MPEWSRWPLVVSLALHVGVFGAGWVRGSPASEVRTDFWAGTTFEAPDLVDEPLYASAEQAERAPDVPTPSAPRGPSAPSRLISRSKTAHGPSTPAGSHGREGGAESSGFGAEGTAPGPRDLLRSFVRAIPAAASSDPVWATVPVGPAGTAELTLVLDADAKPSTSEPIDPEVPPHLRRLILKTLMVLSGGRFAVSADGPAVQRLRIAASVTQLAPPPASEVQPGGAFSLGFDLPGDQRASRAYFTLASGRHVEVTVRARGSR